MTYSEIKQRVFDLLFIPFEEANRLHYTDKIPRIINEALFRIAHSVLPNLREYVIKLTHSKLPARISMPPDFISFADEQNAYLDGMQFCLTQFISDNEIKRIIDYVCKEQVAHYNEEMQNLDATGNGIHGLPNETEEYDDPLYNEIVEFAIQTGKVSTSLLQRRFRLGYNRAARVVDLLEERGIVGPPNGSKPREVLIKLEDKSE